MMSHSTSQTASALSVRDVSMTFGGTRALSEVSVDFARGRVTALLGLNGSGKSTLVKVLAGFYAPDPNASITLGKLTLGLPVDPRLAHEGGLRFVHQNLALVNDLSVADNVALAQGFAARSTISKISNRKHRDRGSVVLQRLGIDIDPSRRVASLSATDRMLVAIARAFDVDSDPGDKVVILDEPTAYLPASAVDRVLGLLENLRQQQATIVYVSHRLDEVRRIADDLVILRDGKVVTTRALDGLGTDEMSALIVGREVQRQPTKKVSHGTEVLLRARRVSGPRLTDVSFDLARGEILGVTGLIGCGRSELARIIAGVQKSTGGQIDLKGRPYEPRDPKEALDRGVAYVPPDRHEAGVIGELTLRANVTLGDLSPFWRRGRLDRDAERTDVEKLIVKFGIRPPRPEQVMANFSGGNQQKAVIAKLSRLAPALLVVDEPTQGIDVNGKIDVTAALRQFAAEGGAVVLASSDFDEVSDLCHRVLVLDRGQSIGVFPPDELDEHRLTAIADRVPTLDVKE